MAKGDIRLSPKYGVNPTIPLCFWCGKPKNEIALMGRIGNARRGEDIEAPRNLVLDYIPCDDCEKNMALGVTVIEVTEEPNATTNHEIQKGIYPTSRWCVLKTEAAQGIFEGHISHTDRKIFVDRQIFSQLFDSQSK